MTFSHYHIKTKFPFGKFIDLFTLEFFLVEIVITDTKNENKTAHIMIEPIHFLVSLRLYCGKINSCTI